MYRLLEHNLDRIKKCCHRFDVESLHAFGSVTSENFRDDSDIDLLIKFKKISFEQYADNYFQLRELLEGILNRKVDLLTERSLSNPFFIKELNKTKTLLEDELFDDEIEKLKRGEPLYPPGEEPGETINRISQDPEVWQGWWKENQTTFNPAIRHRNGKPYSPACLVENLKSEKSLNFVRKMAYEELVIRYGIDFPFETDMFVQRQKEAIAQYERWIEENPDKFEEGKWYFAGTPR